MTKLLLLLIFAVSIMWNAYFMLQNVGNAGMRSQLLQQEEESKIYFTQKIFSEDFKLKDYSSTKFSLEEAWKDIIKNAREFHSSPAIIKWEAYNEYVCAGYIFGLSKILWDASAPYLIGMMEQNTKTPADAWQLPYSYEYVGGEILSDFTGDFSLDDKDYWDEIDSKKLHNFFDIAFSEEVLFGDIGFLYKDTNYLQDLKMYENSNSHITKNIGISEFSRKIKNTENKTNLEIFSETLSCDANIFPKMKHLLSNYEIYLDQQRIVFHEDKFYKINTDNSLGEEIIFQDISNIILHDITLMHFFEWANVDSLFEMTCQWEFFPINIMQINPRFIEKM